MTIRQVAAYLVFGLTGALAGFIIGVILDAQLFQIGLLSSGGNGEIMGAMLTRAGACFAVAGFVAGVATAWARRQLFR